MEGVDQGVLCRGWRSCLAARSVRPVPEDRIHEVARQALDELADARVREFVPIFAWRATPEKLLRKAA